MKKILCCIIVLFFSNVVSVYGGEADVTGVKVTRTGQGEYTFAVTVSHNDEGWKHYANQWDVVGEDGTVYGTRVLYHPHVDEQPFTRSLSGVKIPVGIRQVTIIAHDSVHKTGGRVVTVILPQNE